MSVPATNDGGVRELVTKIARRAVAAAPAGGDPVAGVAALLAVDPRNADHVQAVATVIVCDALADPFRETTANRWRPLLPPWVRPPVVGATVQRLLAAGVLVPTGRYVRCTDRTGRNRGKPQPVYSLDVASGDPPLPLARLDDLGPITPSRS
ncbi:hypothetical protein [Alloactinosynnema sp. L-07]|uniref:hypothetical protein n=1 Tax=Alloactinosynnema sp. L-07 TaxID=1653480 RepID=UPI00065F08DD|nr:hypothetical protein [Alloactinosynnema sp. L-07]CRK55460.1 hypothetical protein [Alloactinosynnema sp. L-07]